MTARNDETMAGEVARRQLLDGTVAEEHTIESAGMSMSYLAVGRRPTTCPPPRAWRVQGAMGFESTTNCRDVQHRRPPRRSHPQPRGLDCGTSAVGKH